MEKENTAVEVTGNKALVMNAKKGFDSSNKYDMDFNREANFALQILQANPFLAKADAESIKNSIVNIALTGLTLNPALKYAYLVPRKDTKRGLLCNLDISYMGMIKLLTDAGAVKFLNADVIHENDDYDFAQGSEPFIHHKRTLKDRGEMIGAYAVAYFRDGGCQFIIMNTEEIHDVRACSESYKAEKTRKYSPWVKWEAEMWKKTAMRRLYKILPKTDFSDQLIAAISVDHDTTVNDVTDEDRFAEHFDDFVEVKPAKDSPIKEEE